MSPKIDPSSFDDVSANRIRISHHSAANAFGPAKRFSGVASASVQSASLRRRFGKTEFAKAWIAQGLLLGEDCAWFAPQHTTWSEVYVDLTEMLAPIVTASARTPPVIRLSTGGRLDFWSLESSIPGRGRGYRRIVIDEAAFTKDGDNHDDDSMMALWEKGIKPTLYDEGGHALVCSNSAGKNPDNFFFNICTDPQYGFHEYHATTMENPLLPKRAAKESFEAWLERQAQFRADLIKDNDPPPSSVEKSSSLMANLFRCPRGATGYSPLSTPPQRPELTTMRRPSFSSRPIPSGAPGF